MNPEIANIQHPTSEVIWAAKANITDVSRQGNTRNCVSSGSPRMFDVLRFFRISFLSRVISQRNGLDRLVQLVDVDTRTMLWRP
jgi:hypothetical protein